MEETDAAARPGGGDRVPEVQSPPAGAAAQLHGPTPPHLLCPY